MFSLDEEVLRRKLAAPLPAWAEHRLAADFAPFSGLTGRRGGREEIDRFLAAADAEQVRRLALGRLSLRGGRAEIAPLESYKYNDRKPVLAAALEAIGRALPLPEVDFLVCLASEAGITPEYTRDPAFFAALPVPVFCFCRERCLPNTVLIPDHSALSGNYGPVREEVLSASAATPWESRLPVLFWRGSTTDVVHPAKHPRATLVELSLAHPQEIDARFTHFWVPKATAWRPPAATLARFEELLARAPLAPKVSQAAHLEHRYLLDIDGTSAAFERAYWQLLSGSLMLKQETAREQWYYGALEPHRHYLPVREDLSDLRDRLAWARENDREAQDIAGRAARLMLDELTDEDLAVYLHHALRRYAALAGERGGSGR